MTGYVKINRSLWRHSFFKEEVMSHREAWLWIISNAAWKPTEVSSANGMIKLKRGDLSYSNRYMAKTFGWSVNKLRRFLSELQQNNMILTNTATDTAKSTAQTIISVCNYCKFQSYDKQTDTATDTATATNKKTNKTNKTFYALGAGKKSFIKELERVAND